MGNSASGAGASTALPPDGAVITNSINLGNSAAGTLLIGVAAVGGGKTAPNGFSGAINLNGDNLTISNSDTGSGAFTVGGTGAGITGSGSLTLNNNSSTSLMSLTNSANGVNNTGTITNSGTGLNDTISANIGANVTGVTQNGASTLLLSGTNTYTGPTTVTTGTLQAGSSTAFGSNSALNVNGGTADLNGQSLTVGNLASTGSTGIILNSKASSASTLTIGGGNGTGGTYSGTIEDNSGTGGTVALTKTGTGTITLAGSNTYRSERDERFQRHAPHHGQHGCYFRDRGQRRDARRHRLRRPHHHPGRWRDQYAGQPSTHTLTIQTLSLTGPGTLSIDIGSAAADVLAVTGSASATGNVFTVNVDNLGLTTGTAYTIVTAGGTSDLAPSDFTVGALTGTSLAGDTAVFGGTSSDITLTFNSSGGGPATAAYYTGAISGDLNVPGNSSTDVTGATPNTGAPGPGTNVFFSANNITNLSPNTGAALDINSLTFGTGSGGTNTGLTLSGSGLLTIEATTANGNSAGVGITVLSGSDTISAPVQLNASQTWAVNSSSSTLTVSNTVSGGSTTTLTKTGAGVLALTGNNNYGGGTTINGGKVQINSATSLGASTGRGHHQFRRAGTHRQQQQRQHHTQFPARQQHQRDRRRQHRHLHH